MPTQEEWSGAYTAKNAVTLRNTTLRRTPYVLRPTDDPTDLIPIFGGTTIQCLVYFGKMFWYDSTDTTTAHDGVTCIVTSDGKRYKYNDYEYQLSVKAYNLNTPPGSPSLGDAYITGPAPTGAWASQAEKIATYTLRGWVFANLKVGQLYYVADGSLTWVFLDENGDIIERFDYQDDTIQDKALIGGQRRFIVTNTTTNAPPGSPGLGAYWIVGSSPTGAWSGHAGEIATNYGSGWVFITPVEGLEAWDVASGQNLIYRTGTGWTGSSGSWIARSDVLTSGSGTAAANAGTGNPGAGQPTTAHRLFLDNVTLSHTASRTNARLRFRYQARISVLDMVGTFANSYGFCVIALFRDSEVNSIAWEYVPVPHVNLSGSVVCSPGSVSMEFLVTAVDAVAHTYKIGFAHIQNNFGTYQGVNSVSRRQFSVEEAQ